MKESAKGRFFENLPYIQASQILCHHDVFVYVVKIPFGEQHSSYLLQLNGFPLVSARMYF